MSNQRFQRQDDQMQSQQMQQMQQPQQLLVMQPGQGGQQVISLQQGQVPMQIVWNGNEFYQQNPGQQVVVIPQGQGQQVVALQGQQVVPQYYIPNAQYQQGVQMVPVMFDNNMYSYVCAPSVAPTNVPQHVVHQSPPQSHRGPRENHNKDANDTNRRKQMQPRHDGSPLMEQFRQNKNKQFEVAELREIIRELSKDQEGSRFIQRKIESDHCTPEEMQVVFEEIIVDALNLMTDVFGNYVIQKLLEYGRPDHRKELIKCMRKNVLQLTLHTYGCRVIQKALEFADEDDQVALAKELDGYVLRCVLDQNGNHVIQKCIERANPYHVSFIVGAFVGNVQSLAVHAYGCRVIQRILEYCEDNPEVIQPILDEILATVNHLVRDQYGNYVVQHVVINGKPVYQYAIMERMRPEIIDLAQHKFASNVIEKLLQYCDADSRKLLLEELLKPVPGQDCSGLIMMMKDQYANYVVQKLLEVAEDAERKVIIDHIKPHIAQLRKYTYGKHIIARIEKGHTGR